MKTTLLFVRHGQSIANENGIFAGNLDVPLSELGQKQAVELKDYLLSRYKIDAIYSSDLSRAYATVLPTAEAIKIPIQKDTALREIDGGKWEGMLQKEIAVEYPQDYAVWHNNTGLSRCTGGGYNCPLPCNNALYFFKHGADCVVNTCVCGGFYCGGGSGCGILQYIAHYPQKAGVLSCVSHKIKNFSKSGCLFFAAVI